MVVIVVVVCHSNTHSLLVLRVMSVRAVGRHSHGVVGTLTVLQVWLIVVAAAGVIIRTVWACPKRRY